MFVESIGHPFDAFVLGHFLWVRVQHVVQMVMHYASVVAATSPSAIGCRDISLVSTCSHNDFNTFTINRKSIFCYCHKHVDDDDDDDDEEED